MSGPGNGGGTSGGNGGTSGAVLGAQTNNSGRRSVKLAQVGSGDTTESVLGETTSATESPKAVLGQESEQNNNSVLNWIMNNKKISVGILIGILALVYIINRYLKRIR
jgi:hypothetical protein